MSRQLLGIKKVKRLRKLTGLPIEKVMVRGNTDHRQDLCLTDGRIFCRYPDGELFEIPFNWKV